VGNNCYTERPEAMPSRAALVFRRPGDLPGGPTFLSVNPADRDYLRVPAAGPEATGGAGGSLPSYVGALPPGPAPKEGDWFTRLRDRWPDAPLPPLSVPEPPPLAEWLKGRTVLTVAQDGKGQFKTIQAALDALKPGQAVKVLDKGPYRERLRPRGDLPADCGLVSDVGTVIELPDAPESWEQQPAVARMCSVGHYLTLAGGFRLHGFDLTFPAREDGQGLGVLARDGFVLENCRLRMPTSGRDLNGAVYIDSRPLAGARPVVVRECRIDGRVGILGLRKLPPTVAVLVRNHFSLTAPDYRGVVAASCHFERIVFRHNVITCPHECYIQTWDLTGDPVIDISNNTFQYPGSILIEARGGVMKGPVRITSNLFADQGFIVTRPAIPPEVTRRWDIGYNVFRGHLDEGLPMAATDRVGAVRFLSGSPADRDYLRVPTDSPVVTPGAVAGYAGALPPGPAPKGGDWFTRLRDRWPDPPATPKP
jgi:hypothetical protein